MLSLEHLIIDTLSGPNGINAVVGILLAAALLLGNPIAGTNRK